MDKIFKIETTLSDELAELYAGLLEEFESRSHISLSELNRTLLQTGLIQHLVMMEGLGLIQGAKAERLRILIDRIAQQTIMREVVQLVRAYWKKNAGGTGLIDLRA